MRPLIVLPDRIPTIPPSARWRSGDAGTVHGPLAWFKSKSGLQLFRHLRHRSQHRQAAGVAAAVGLKRQAATDGALSLAAGYIGLMTETPPTKPPLRERLKLPDNCVDVTGQHVGEVFVLTGYGTHDGSARGAWIKKDKLADVLPPAFLLKKPDR